MKQLFLVFAGLLSILAVSAQIPTGTWKTYFSYDEGTSVTLAGDKVYAVGSGFLFSYGLHDNAITTYSKINGLNDVSISIVRYYDAKDLLFIGYENGNIDVISDNDIINIQDIKLANINGSKAINNVTFYQNMAYVSSDVGVVVLNLDRYETVETYILNDESGQNPVNGVAILEGNIFAATNKGIYSCNLDNQNILNFSNWNVESRFPGINDRYADILNYNGQLIGVRADGESGAYTIYRSNESTADAILSGGVNYRNIQIINKQLVSCTAYRVYVFNDDLSAVDYITKYNFEDLAYEGQDVLRCNDVLKIDDGTFFIADRELGLVRYTKEGYSEILKPNGPASNTIWNMDINESIVRTVHGGLTGSWNNTSTPGEVSVLKDNEWDVINKNSLPEIGTAIDFVNIKSDPLNPEHFFVASYGYGLYEFNGMKLSERYDDSNSPIINRIPGKWFYRMFGLAFDDSGDLWLNNNAVSLPVHVLQQDGTWYSAHYDQIDGSGSDAKGSLGEIIITTDNNKWLQIPRTEGGIFVFNENGTLENSNDDLTRMLHVEMDNENEEFANVVTCITEDKDGVIWVGTNNGIGVFYSPEDVFEESTMFPSRIKLPRENDEDDAADYLLDSETVRDITTDGGNRKWIGTAASGVLLVSPDGLTTIHHFTSDNSPLPSNTIKAIEIDELTGEVFIATAVGIVSFGGDATAGSSDFNSVKAYPNPVRESFTGLVTISGLVRETIVKITDISGNLVFETTSNGGSVSWNRKNLDGDYVGTGVYMIFCATKDGEQSTITKLLVINSKQ